MYRKIPLSIEVKKVLKLLMATLLGMLLLCSSYFFIKTTYSAEKGYKLRENQLLKKDLESENKILKQRVLDAQSLSELKKSGTVKEMQEPTQSIYIIPAGPLSKKK